VITGMPLVILDRTTNAPPNTDWVATPSASRSTTSASRPEPVRRASRPAISLPSGLAEISTAAGETRPASAARTSTFGLTR
jgi:hypothetical protein